MVGQVGEGSLEDAVCKPAGWVHGGEGTWVLGGHGSKDPETLESEASAASVSVSSCQAAVPTSEPGQRSWPPLLAMTGEASGPGIPDAGPFRPTLHFWPCVPHASVGRSGHPAYQAFPPVPRAPRSEASRLALAQLRLLLAVSTCLLLGLTGLAPGPSLPAVLTGPHSHWSGPSWRPPGPCCVLTLASCLCPPAVCC